MLIQQSAGPLCSTVLSGRDILANANHPTSLHYYFNDKTLADLDDFAWRRCQLGSKYNVPEPTCNTKAILIIHEVMLEVILLQLSPIGWQISVMEEVVCQIIADITKDSSAKHGRCNMPVPEEDSMSKLPERSRKNQEKCGRHD